LAVLALVLKKSPLLLRAGLLCSIAALVCVALFGARRSLDEREAFFAAMRDVRVVPPAGAPSISQHSVDLAVVIYGIEIPTNADHPALDVNLGDRGLTVRGAWLERSMVKIGPSAFSSWGLLGSTIAHEVEVHCRQSFLVIHLMDVFGFDGTGAAERQAYRFELANSKRFGLEPEDRELIVDTVDFFYPQSRKLGEQGGLAATRLGRWMARGILTERADP
jgi:hypothetical protein